MARDTLTGSRIRERRVMAGIRQAELARQLGISASYLNLIEHNRRRIGGKLLVAIAGALDVEPSLLTEGVGEALIAVLGEAAADIESAVAEIAETETFARRFPGWAETIAQQHRRIATLERTVAALTDRLSHDPQLATSLHEVLTTAAAVRSVASILAEPGELDPTWRARFTANLNADSLRLAESSKALMTYLDRAETGSERRALPREEAEAVLAAHDFSVEVLETPDAQVRDAKDLLGMPSSTAAMKILEAMLQQYLLDAQALPRRLLLKTVAAEGSDVLRIARVLQRPLPLVMRRLAVMPEAELPGPVGLVICDAAGSILFHKQVGTFTVPRAVAPCPLWPLFQALCRLQVPIRQRVVQTGRSQTEFDSLAVATMVQGTEYAAQPQVTALMLTQAAADAGSSGQETLEVGSSCRVCARVGCSARREPSLLTESGPRSI